MNTTLRLARAIPAALLILAPMAPPAVANTAPDTVIAADTTPEPAAPSPAPSVSRMVGIDANVVSGLTVTGAGGSRITLTAHGERTRTATLTRTKAAVFRHLTPGTAYTVRVNGTIVGTGTPVGRVGAAVGLTVSTTAATDEVLLRWNQQPTRGQGSSISYIVTARPVIALGRSTTAPEISGVTTERAATIAVDPSIRYAFTVTPRNTASTGTPSTAVMTRTLAELHGSPDVPTVTAPPVQPPAALIPAPAPAPAGPSTKTIYVCPDTFTENARGVCERTTPYTFTTLAYTFHTETTGPAPMLDSYETPVAACPSGYNLEDYGWVKYCRRYGPAPTRTVKDPTPAGYTDTGTEWSSKNTPPAGYTDTGAAWVTTTAKIPKVVPA
jgi:hypothetical protein